MGNSMNPLILPGDRISLQLIDVHELKIGDIFVFRDGESLVVHRLVGKKELKGQWWVCEKGDNVESWRWLPGEWMLGRVQVIHGRGGPIRLSCRPWTWINRCLGTFLCIGVAIQERGHVLRECLWGPKPLPLLSDCGTKLWMVFHRAARISLMLHPRSFLSRDGQNRPS